MNFDLKLDNNSKGVLFKRLALMSLKIRQNVEQEVEKSSKAIQATAKSRAPRDTGALARSIARKKFNDGLTGVVYTKTSRAGGKSGTGYAHLVEFGSGGFYRTPPGVSRGGSAGPYRPSSTRMLAEWAERHNLPAYPVARAIGERGGVQGRPFLFPAYEGERASFTRALRRAIWNRGVKSVAAGAA